MDNGHGNPELGFWISEGCPLHAPAPKDGGSELPTPAYTDEAIERTPLQHFQIWWTDYCRYEPHNLKDVPLSVYYETLAAQKS
jgi:hypothetical protein